MDSSLLSFSTSGNNFMLLSNSKGALSNRDSPLASIRLMISIWGLPSLLNSDTL